MKRQKMKNARCDCGRMVFVNDILEGDGSADASFKSQPIHPLGCCDIQHGGTRTIENGDSILGWGGFNFDSIPFDDWGDGAGGVGHGEDGFDVLLSQQHGINPFGI